MKTKPTTAASLIELLVSLSIVLILTSLGLVVYLKWVKVLFAWIRARKFGS